MIFSFLIPPTSTCSFEAHHWQKKIPFEQTAWTKHSPKTVLSTIFSYVAFVYQIRSTCTNLIDFYINGSLYPTNLSQNKKKLSFACGVHCLIYAFVVWAFTLFTWPWWTICIVFATHFILDRWHLVRWMILPGRDKFFEEPMFPWSYIVLDNTWHLLVLFILDKMIM